MAECTAIADTVSADATGNTFARAMKLANEMFEHFHKGTPLVHFNDDECSADIAALQQTIHLNFDYSPEMPEDLELLIGTCVAIKWNGP